MTARRRWSSGTLRWTCVSILLAALALGVGLRADEDPKVPPATPRRSPEPRHRLEDAALRGFAKAFWLRVSSLQRVTITPQEVDSDDSVLVLAEFASGEVGIFAAAAAPGHDQWILVPREALEILEEVVDRAKKQNHKVR